MPDEKTKGTLINYLDLEPMECVKGISFDPEVTYEFEISEIIARKIMTTDRAGHEKELAVIDASCIEKESQAVIRMSFFHGKTVTIDEEHRDKESSIVKFARAVGYPVGLGKVFRFSDVVRPGIRFNAHTKLQIGKDKKETGYSEINLDTVQVLKTKGGAQANIQARDTSSIDPAILAEIRNLAAGYPNKETLIQNIFKQNKSNLLNDILALDSAGQLTYSK